MTERQKSDELIIGSTKLENTTEIPTQSTEKEKSATFVVNVNTAQLKEISAEEDENYHSIFPEALTRLPENLTFSRGIQLIVGPNGAGKTTLLIGIVLAQNNVNYSNNDKTANFLREKFNRSFIDQNRMSVRVADAIKTTEKREYRRIDVAQGFYHQLESNALRAAEAGMAGLELNRASRIPARSTRQIKDDYFTSYAEQKKLKDFDGLVFIDEPESGMDPWRHQQILEYINSHINPDATIIIATNSPILAFNNSLKRIDLRTPEKGLFLPEAK